MNPPLDGPVPAADHGDRGDQTLHTDPPVHKGLLHLCRAAVEFYLVLHYIHTFQPALFYQTAEFLQIEFSSHPVADHGERHQGKLQSPLIPFFSLRGKSRSLADIFHADANILQHTPQRGVLIQDKSHLIQIHLLRFLENVRQRDAALADGCETGGPGPWARPFPHILEVENPNPVPVLSHDLHTVQSGIFDPAHIKLHVQLRHLLHQKGEDILSAAVLPLRLVVVHQKADAVLPKPPRRLLELRDLLCHLRDRGLVEAEHVVGDILFLREGDGPVNAVSLPPRPGHMDASDGKALRPDRVKHLPRRCHRPDARRLIDSGHRVGGEALRQSAFLSHKQHHGLNGGNPRLPQFLQRPGKILPQKLSDAEGVDSDFHVSFPLSGLLP